MAMLMVRVLRPAGQLDGAAREFEAAAPYAIGLGDEREAGHGAGIAAADRRLIGRA